MTRLEREAFSGQRDGGTWDKGKEGGVREGGGKRGKGREGRGGEGGREGKRGWCPHSFTYSFTQPAHTQQEIDECLLF